MEAREPRDDNEKKRIRKHVPKLTKKKLDRFLSSICEAAGMTGKAPAKKETPGEKPKRLPCRGDCGGADWRAHLDVPSGVLCVSAAWSSNKKADRHRDVTIAITYKDENGKVNFTDMVFCDSEVRWLVETLWHAPIWE